MESKNRDRLTTYRKIAILLLNLKVYFTIRMNTLSSSFSLYNLWYIHSLAVEEMTQVHARSGTEGQIYFITSSSFSDLVVTV